MCSSIALFRAFICGHMVAFFCLFAIGCILSVPDKPSSQ